jgi:glyoxylase-like metal-dependent hydrolase (beta-lactamase superfamily II)
VGIEDPKRLPQSADETKAPFSIGRDEASFTNTVKPSIKLVEVCGLRPFPFDPTQGPLETLHGILVEGHRSLLLVEVGLGALDYVAPVHRLGFFSSLRFASKPPTPLRQQLVMAGYHPDDVTDIFVSHLHVRHSGGLSDFPTARVHGLPHGIAPHSPRLARLLPEPTRWLEPHAIPRRFAGLSSYPLVFEDFEFSIVDLPGRFSGHAGLLMPYHDGHVFHVGGAVDSLAELTLPATTTRGVWSTLTSPQPFSDLLTVNRLRRIYQNPKSNLIFVSSTGDDSQLPSADASLPPLPLLKPNTDG